MNGNIAKIQRGVDLTCGVYKHCNGSRGPRVDVVSLSPRRQTTMFGRTNKNSSTPAMTSV